MAWRTAKVIFVYEEDPSSIQHWKATQQEPAQEPSSGKGIMAQKNAKDIPTLEEVMEDPDTQKTL